MQFVKGTYFTRVILIKIAIATKLTQKHSRYYIDTSVLI